MLWSDWDVATLKSGVTILNSACQYNVVDDVMDDVAADAATSLL